MSDDEDIVLFGAMLFLAAPQSKKRRSPRFWEGPIVKRRREQGLEQILADLVREDSGLAGELRLVFLSRSFVK